MSVDFSVRLNLLQTEKKLDQILLKENERISSKFMIMIMTKMTMTTMMAV
jgi:hypothetical protein